MKILLSCLIVLATVLTPDQGQQYKLIKKIDIKGKQFTTDPLGNCYVESNRKIFKYSYDGKLINNYSNNNFGEIYSLDATNPYKLLIFYQQFGKLIFLDNMLSDNSAPISLLRTEYDQTKLVCHSFDNGYWIYEPLLNELFKVTPSLQQVQQTGNLSVILRKQLNPNFLIEFNSRIYLNNPKTGILVFDQYGTYLKTIPLKNLSSFQVKEDRIHYLENNALLTYFFKTFETDTTALPISENLIDIQIQKKRMFLLTKEALNIYQLQ